MLPASNVLLTSDGAVIDLFKSNRDAGLLLLAGLLLDALLRATG